MRGVRGLVLATSSVLTVGAVAFPGCAAAAIVEADARSNSETGFDGNILTNDLIEQGNATLVATAGANFPASGSVDGTATHTNGLTYYGGPPSNGVDLTFTLSGSATGYDISTINGIYGWQDSRYRHAAQEWTVSVATVSNPTLTPIKTVIYTPFAANDGAAGSSQVTLTDDSTGTIASGVTQISFHLTPYGSPGATGYSGEIGVVREFDVSGIATVTPEPATLGVFALGATSLLTRNRRR